MNRAPSRKATIYLRGRRLLVERCDTTTDGIPFGTDDIAVFDVSVADETLGRALQEAIQRARSGVRPLASEEWKAGLKPMLTAAGVGSWTAFVRGTRSVAVFESDGLVTLRPSVNLGAKHGYGPIDEEAPQARSGNSMHLGQVAKIALDLAIAGPA